MERKKKIIFENISRYFQWKFYRNFPIFIFSPNGPNTIPDEGDLFNHSNENSNQNSNENRNHVRQRNPDGEKRFLLNKKQKNFNMLSTSKVKWLDAVRTVTQLNNQVRENQF